MIDPGSGMVTVSIQLTHWNIALSLVLLSLPRSRFLDVTQPSPNWGSVAWQVPFWMSRNAPLIGGALRDIQKTAARETKFCCFAIN